MKLQNQEIKFLVNKYKKEGLKEKQIYSRLKDIFTFQEFVKFKNKYL